RHVKPHPFPTRRSSDLSSAAAALDLRQAYEAALAHDAQYAAARAAYTASLQNPVLARASLLPQVGANAEIARLKTDRLPGVDIRSEEHTSELQSRENLV